MKTPILTVAHEFHVQLNHAVFSAEGGVPAHESLDAATDLLASVVAGLAELVQENSVSNQATLLHFAANSVLALLESIAPGLDEEFAPRSAEPENVARNSEPVKFSKFAVTLVNRIEESLQSICALSKNWPATGEILPLAGLTGEEGIQSAIKLVSGMALRDMYELLSEVDISHE
ncbi:hypothetical protein [Pseudomonas sp. JAI120]|uniref:hypothetical protein n=1 Tax=Pseudomonas sp. JAI120 TaxID=2723063 RepID=UPI0030D8F664